MNPKPRIFFIQILLCITCVMQAASVFPEQGLTWKNIMPEGKKAVVYCIYTDSRGLVWIGSNDGLYFYDGVSSRITGSEEFSDAQIYSITEHCGCLYVGSDRGLAVYDHRTSSVSVVNGAPKDIRCFQVTGDRLWVGSLSGIFMMDTASGHWQDISGGLPHKSVYSMLNASDGNMYVGTYNGLARWNGASESFVPICPSADFLEKTNLFVNCLLDCPEEKAVLVGTEGALYQYYPEDDRWEKTHRVGDCNIKCMARAEDGSLLVGSDNGFWELTRNATRNYQYDSRNSFSIANNAIWCVHVDAMGNIWTGHGRGFSIAGNSGSVRTIRWSSLLHTGEGCEIHTMMRDSRGEFWVGGTNGALRMSPDGDIDWYRHQNNVGSLSHNTVRSIMEDTEGRVWLCTDGGIDRYNSDTETFDVFHIVDKEGGHHATWVYAMEENADHYWVGSFLGGIHRVGKEKMTQPGVVVAENSLNSETSDSYDNDFVRDVVLDDDGNIWSLLFGNGNLMCYNVRDDIVEKHDILAITGETPTHIAKDDAGRVWCAFRGGVAIFIGEDSPHVIKLPYTSGDETVLALSQVGDDMWISTQSNVWKIGGKDLKATILPIPSRQYVSIYEDPISGKVLLGGIDEIVEISKDDLGTVIDYNSIKLVMAEDGSCRYLLSGHDGGFDRVVIPHGGRVTLSVSTLDYSPEYSHRYMYKLSKSEEDIADGWVVMPESVNAITFSDLKMGDYKVLVKMADSPVSHISIPLTVEAPMALSWWAVTLYVMLLVIIVISVVWYIRRQNILKMQKEERRKYLEGVERKLTFLSNISHDLKTPLSMIMGPASLMKEKAADPDMRRTMGMIYDNAVRLNNMIHRTLELNHLKDEDESLLILSTIDIVAFCRSIFDTFKENNPSKTFLFDTSCPSLFIEADAIKLESVITNILSNACKYSEDRATITCGIRRKEDLMEIIISDDGVGISEVDQPLVFQRMFRSPSIAKLREGTGLGLYLIKKYVELMNGSIDLYSKEGVGTTFTVSLPVTEKTLTHMPDGVEAKDSDRTKILIVEDNPEIRGFVEQLFKDNYCVLTADNGRAGLAIASSFTPSLLIVDEMMPVMSGLEMCRRIKQNPHLASMPIIMLTAKDDNQTENESIKLGIDAFMSKPFDPTSLCGRVDQLLSARDRMKENIRLEALVQTTPIEVESVIEKQLAKIAATVEENISDPDFNVNQLSEKADIPVKQLYRIIKKYMGVGPLDYIKSLRLQKAAILLSQKRFTVAEVAYLVGFNTPSYFAKCFQVKYGVSPSDYQSDDDLNRTV